MNRSSNSLANPLYIITFDRLPVFGP